ncbi:AAA ATPase chaperone [Desulfosarcina variabilis str. Montpellier]|uniref:ATP-binding protein n=1 Tax=Desulfosarcina variabilis TaxID=2300 RepID=UPI003AFA54AA
MNDLTKWQTNNDRYLVAAMAWLRLGLSRLANGSASDQPPENRKTEPPAPLVDETPRGWFGMRKHTANKPAPAAEKAPDNALATAAAAMAEAAKAEPPPAMIILGRCLGLSTFEQQILLLCAAMELDTRIPALCAQAQAHPNRAYPTFALALALFDDPAWDALSADRPLRYWRLIEINQPGATPLTASALRADERIVNYLKGLNTLDDRLSPLVDSLFRDVVDRPVLPPSQEQQALEITNRLQAWVSDGRASIIELLGRDGESKRAVARRAAIDLGLHLYRLDPAVLPAQWADVEAFSRLWQRECRLMPLALYVDMGAVIGSGPGETQAAAIARFIDRARGVFFLDVAESNRITVHPAVSVQVHKPTPQEQRSLWLQALGAEADALAGRLAAQFNMNPQEIGKIAAAITVEEESDVSRDERLWNACLSASRPKLDRLAERIDAKATWEDIVLPAQERTLLGQIAQQVRQRSRVYEDWGFSRKMNRGLGISALFSGESGTGKTMAAEVIANELKLHLYRIDLSAVVNKYIGETEKNLRRVFDAAEDSGAILFFDEADALFGKRSEVKDSHDRYANIEINYLLQRMEAYRGLAILATNMKRALDAAFMRRLRFIVNFPFPGLKERKRIWQNVFPKTDASCGLCGVPVDGLNCDQLAKLNLTGGSIHNIALNAAFLAARTGAAVTMEVVHDAARTEFRKLEKPINEADFRLLQSVGSRA